MELSYSLGTDTQRKKTQWQNYLTYIRTALFTVWVDLVPSNYHAKGIGEKQISISGPVSLDTLRSILAWAEKKKAAINNDEIL